MRKFDQPIGTTVGGFTVGHRATTSFTKAVGTIVGINGEGGTQKVVVEFDEPQPVDAPEGATGHRFELDWRNIKSTWRELESVVFENILEGQFFTVPEDGDGKVYQKITPGEGEMTTVHNQDGVSLGCGGFLGMTCMPQAGNPENTVGVMKIENPSRAMSETLRKQRQSMQVEPIHAEIEPVQAYAKQIAKLKGESFHVVTVPKNSAAHGMGYRFVSIPGSELSYYLENGASLAVDQSIGTPDNDSSQTVQNQSHKKTTSMTM